MKSLYKYFILFLIITSCEPKEKNSNSFSIYFEPDNKIIKLSDISHIYEIIKLKDDSSNVIGNIDKLICRNGRIYILDSYGSKSIFVFDETGELLLKINNVGKGPGEYLYPNDFDISDYNGEIHVLDTNLRKVIVYNKKGVYVREIHIKFSPFSFAVTNDGKYIFSLGNYPIDNVKKIIITDFKGNILKYSEKVHVTSDFKNLMLGEQKEIHHINNKIYITPLQQNKIFIYNQDEVEEKYTLDFGKYNLPKEIFPDDLSRENKIKKLMNSHYVYFISNYCETDKYLLFTSIVNSKLIYFFYNKHDNVTFCTNRIVDDVLNIGFPNCFTTDNNFIYGIFDSYHIELVKPYINNNKLKAIIKQMNSFSNPIVIKYKLKNE